MATAMITYIHDYILNPRRVRIAASCSSGSWLCEGERLGGASANDDSVQVSLIAKPADSLKHSGLRRILQRKASHCWH